MAKITGGVSSIAPSMSEVGSHMGDGKKTYPFQEQVGLMSESMGPMASNDRGKDSSERKDRLLP